MSISGIQSGTSLSLADLLSTEQEEDNSILNSSSVWASSTQMLNNLQNRKAQNAYGGSGASSLGQAALRRALSEMNSGGNASVTFADIAAYRADLEEQFSAKTRLELLERGVSLDTPFTLTMSASGSIQVQCDDALAKEKIQSYLEENPEACDQFGYIQALSNLERARQSSFGSAVALQEAREATASMRSEAVEAFFGSAMNSGMNYASIMAQFGSSLGLEDASSSVSFYAGLDFTV
ncbi:hypothetical protein LJC15_03025 [Desulfovibrio sp. OttesenSCG-928-G11]|nr:hypothetical protein [Desulfovibrio sp. OttesenSCG-928-G11]